MKAILSAVVVLGLCGVVGTGDEKADPVGTWKCEYDIGGQKRESTLVIKKDGDKLAGTMTFQDKQEAKLKDVMFKDGELTFSAERELKEMKLTIQYKVKVDGDKLQGKGEAEFGGEKREFDFDGEAGEEVAADWQPRFRPFRTGSETCPYWTRNVRCFATPADFAPRPIIVWAARGRTAGGAIFWSRAGGEPGMLPRMPDVTRLLDAAAAGEPGGRRRTPPARLRRAAEAGGRAAGGREAGPDAQRHRPRPRGVPPPGRGGDPATWNGRGHFFAAAAEAMRRDPRRRGPRARTGPSAAGTATASSSTNSRRRPPMTGRPPTCWPWTRP